MPARIATSARRLVLHCHAPGPGSRPGPCCSDNPAGRLPGTSADRQASPARTDRHRGTSRQRGPTTSPARLPNNTQLSRSRSDPPISSVDPGLAVASVSRANKIKMRCSGPHVGSAGESVGGGGSRCPNGSVILWSTDLERVIEGRQGILLILATTVPIFMTISSTCAALPAALAAITAGLERRNKGLRRGASGRCLAW